ncbi:hypothetical protein AB1Y20_006885 [Prymnesium parvum]|uniref:MRN complex-interacting protein N-terminal domain-containing protein n=1 Tax=Prymnesium parvum TaxID=97485 RepID=A0AB34J1M8_PRYPA
MRRGPLLAPVPERPRATCLFPCGPYRYSEYSFKPRELEKNRNYKPARHPSPHSARPNFPLAAATVAMPQVHMIVRCNDACGTFQVIQRTQQARFMCRLCAAKQSITRVYASSAAKELRPICQQLNMARAAASHDDSFGAEEELFYQPEAMAIGGGACPAAFEAVEQHQTACPPRSKWAQYMVEEQEAARSEDEDYDPQYITNADIPGRQKRRRDDRTELPHAYLGAGAPAKCLIRQSEAQHGASIEDNQLRAGDGKAPSRFEPPLGLAAALRAPPRDSQWPNDAPQVYASKAARRCEDDDMFFMSGMDSVVEDEVWCG